MFRHLSALIMAQGEKIDSIEKHVETAKRYVEQANKSLQKASEHQVAARWKKCCILVCFLVIAFIIIVPVVATQTA